MHSPSQIDLRTVVYLGRFLGRYPRFDMTIESAIVHGILGGLWYAAALFYWWVKGEASADTKIRTRVLSIFAGVGIAILLAIAATKLVSWPAPSRTVLRPLFPDYLPGNFTASSFPSFSTAMYTAVAIGVYTLSRLAGILLLVGIPLLIALPRIYVGGHYPTDVLFGCILGLMGSVIACTVLERRIVEQMARIFQYGKWPRVAGDMLVFIAIWQVAVEFREVIWVRRVISLLLK